MQRYIRRNYSDSEQMIDMNSSILAAKPQCQTYLLDDKLHLLDIAQIEASKCIRVEGRIVWNPLLCNAPVEE